MKHNTIKRNRLFLLSTLFALVSFFSYAQSYRLPAIITFAPSLARQNNIDSFNKSQTAFASLTKQEQELLYWLNLSRKNPRLFYDEVVAPAINEIPELKQGGNWKSLQKDLYAAPSLPLFKVHDGLMKIARSHAADMSRKGGISHDGGKGKSMPERFASVGVTGCGGENLALSPGEPYLSVILLYLDLGVPDLGHRKAFMNPLFTRIGLSAKAVNANLSCFVFDFTCE